MDSATRRGIGVVLNDTSLSRECSVVELLMEVEEQKHLLFAKVEYDRKGGKGKSLMGRTAASAGPYLLSRD